jgi:predicted nucleic acid-binding protein
LAVDTNIIIYVLDVDSGAKHDLAIKIAFQKLMLLLPINLLTLNAVVYYLFFASQKPVAEDIVKDIFKKYKNRRG